MKDARTQESLSAAYKDHPDFAPRVINSHRHWLVQPLPDPAE